MGAAKTTSHNLTPQQEQFCHFYASDREFFGNGMQSYMEAYKIPAAKWKSAIANASRLLRNDNILRRINELLDAQGLNDAHVDKQLYLTLTQCADLKSKVAAIKEYNTLRNRTKNTLQVDFTEEAKAALAKLSTILP